MARIFSGSRPMRNGHVRHLRLVTPHEEALERFNRASHSDALPEMQILPFAEHVQADPVAIVKSIPRADFIRAEERRVGKECVSTCRSRWSAYQSKKKKTRNTAR